MLIGLPLHMRTITDKVSKTALNLYVFAMINSSTHRVLNLYDYNLHISDVFVICVHCTGRNQMLKKQSVKQTCIYISI